MKLRMELCSAVVTLTPTLSRKREREQFPLSPGNGGEGRGEGVLQNTAAELKRKSGGWVRVCRESDAQLVTQGPPFKPPASPAGRRCRIRGTVAQLISPPVRPR